MGTTIRSATFNGDTLWEPLIRSRYLLFKSADKWADRQKERAAILFGEYPDSESHTAAPFIAYYLLQETIKEAARLAMARWYDKIKESVFTPSMS